MILPIVLNLALSVDKPSIVVSSPFEKDWQLKDNNLSNNNYQHTTKDINPTPSEYIEAKTREIINLEIYNKLFQEEKEY